MLVGVQINETQQIEQVQSQIKSQILNLDLNQLWTIQGSVLYIYQINVSVHFKQEYKSERTNNQNKSRAGKNTST